MSNKLTIAEIVDRKDSLRQAIIACVKSFEDETDVIVEDIKLIRYPIRVIGKHEASRVGEIQLKVTIQ
jgi:1,6-anhydro-N-acetylmuramate kinase